jgi:gluconolactonase
MTQYTEIASGLRFPEGPIAMADGSLVLVEIERGTLSRVTPAGAVEVVAELGGGPNGAAIGPDGRCYVCNNGGFEWHDFNGNLFPGDQPADYKGGRIEVVDLKTGAFQVLYKECNGLPLKGPNDIVFDNQGGFYFTDLGKSYGRVMDRGAVFYATADGKSIREVAYPIFTPNGIGLSPDERRLFVAETMTARLLAFDIIAPGQVAPSIPPEQCIAGMPGFQFFDSLAVDAEGTVCIGTIVNGGITCISPDGQNIEHIATDDAATTNICFGGPGLRTAYITLSASGRLVSCDWKTPGLPLNFLNK